MTELKYDGNTVADVINAKQNLTAQKIVNTALDGTTYVQNVGNAITRYILDIYCETKALRDAVDLACNLGARLTLDFGENNTVDGFIEDNTISWKEWKDGHAVGKITFIKE